MEIELSISALTPSQYRPFMKMFRPDPQLLKIFQKISGRTGSRAMRLYFDFRNDKLLKQFSPECPSEIKEYLVEKGFVLEDYVSGTVRDKHDRVMRLGKVLSKNPTLAKTFETDPARKALVTVTRGKKTICLSMHPYDIAGMSTGRGWTSCMNLDDGINREYVDADVKQHTLVAYMIDTSDRDIKRPLSRTLLKRFYGTNKRHFFYHVEKTYPDRNVPFLMSVQEFANENLNKILMGEDGLNGMYSIQSDLYTDTQSNIFPQLSFPDSNELEVKNILRTNPISLVGEVQWAMLAKRFGADLFGMVFDEDRLGDPSSVNSVSLTEFCSSMQENLSKEDFQRMMVSLAAWTIRTGNDRIMGYALQQIVLLDANIAATIMARNENIDRVIKRVADNIGVWLPIAREPLSERYRFAEKAVDMFVRSRIIRDAEKRFDFFADITGRCYSALADSDFLDKMKQFEDIYPQSVIVERAYSFWREEFQILPLVKSESPHMNREMGLASHLSFVLRKLMPEEKQQEFCAAMDMPDNIYGAVYAIVSKPEYHDILKSNCETFNIGYVMDDRKDKAIFYPEKGHPTSDKDFLFSVNECMYDAVLTYMEDKNESNT